MDNIEWLQRQADQRVNIKRKARLQSCADELREKAQRCEELEKCLQGIIDYSNDENDIDFRPHLDRAKELLK